MRRFVVVIGLTLLGAFGAGCDTHNAGGNHVPPVVPAPVDYAIEPDPTLPAFEEPKASVALSPLWTEAPKAPEVKIPGAHAKAPPTSATPPAPPASPVEIETTIPRGSTFRLRPAVLSPLHPLAVQVLNTTVDGVDGKPFRIVSKLELATARSSREAKTFYFSKILAGDATRSFVIMYAKSPKGVWVPRLLYKSQSDGGWRSAPEIYPDGVFSKGKYIHYVQETKPVEQIAQHLGVMEGIPGFVHQVSGPVRSQLEFEYKRPFKGLKAANVEIIEDWVTNDETGLPELKKIPNPAVGKGVYTYDDEISVFVSGHTPDRLKLFQICRAGSCFKVKKDAKGSPPMLDAFYKVFKGLDPFYPPEFIPDFSKAPIRHYELAHTLLGPTQFQVYLGKLEGRPIEWHMAYDKHKRVWIDRINFVDGDVSSYGVYRVVINSGLLTNKPLEYLIQAGYLLKPSPGFPKEKIIKAFIDAAGKESTQYADITPLLAALRPIHEFKIAKKFTKK